ncbi:MAG: phosphotriesterase [Dorea sp.]|nr:phosphotriesterase [Dorea sp.]
MKEIMTVTGPVSPEKLGFCQCHEHIALSKGQSYLVNPALCIDDMEKSLEELRRYRSFGGDSVIEAQPCGCNRMAGELVRLSEESGVHIIASTGFHKLLFYPKDHWIHTMPAQELEELFAGELEKGMYVDGDRLRPARQCTARAGIIKTAYDTEELSPRYQELFRGAALAAMRTDRVIMIHVEQGTDPRRLFEYLAGLGVRPQRLMFCHMDRAVRDLEIHKEILKNGAYLEFDTIGRFKYHSDEHEISIFRELTEAGFQDQLLYSLDTTRERLKSYQPSAVGLDYILNTFNPLLEAFGISEDMVRKFSVTNPARMLTQ